MTVNEFKIKTDLEICRPFALQQNWEQIKRNLLIAFFKASISLTFQSYIDIELNYKMDTLSKKIID